MPLVIYFLIIIVLQVSVTWWFYREEKYFAPLISLFVNLFALSSLLVLDSSFHVNPIFLGAYLLLVDCAGYAVFFRGGFKKVLAVTILSNSAGLGIGLLMVKCFG